jgi:hypothetical protein
LSTERFIAIRLTKPEPLRSSAERRRFLAGWERNDSSGHGPDSTAEPIEKATGTK